MDGAQTLKGIKSTRHGNILAAKIIADTVRSTLGPRGMDKVLVDEFGNITVTNDGATILRDLQTDHPVARMISEIALAQENEVGDGTTSAVLLAGELLKNAEQLLDSQIHPTIISKGYKLAASKAQDILQKEAKTFPKTKESLFFIAKTAMTGKSAEFESDVLARLCVEAVLHVYAEDKNNTQNNNTLNGSDGKNQTHKDILSQIQVHAQKSGKVSDSVLHKGFLIDKCAIHAQMPQEITQGRIALLTCPIELKETEVQSRISIKSPEQLEQFLAQEEQTLKNMVAQLQKANVQIVCTTKGIDDLAAHYLYKAGIHAIRRVKQSDIITLAKSTSATLTNTFDAIQTGICSVSQIILNNEKYTLFTQTPNAHTASIIVHGSTTHVSDELARAVDDALGDLCAIIRDNKIVGGAGCIEIAIAKDLMTYAKTCHGREQLAIESFAKALEVIPRTLAQNAGLDPIDSIVSMYASKDKGICIDGGLIDVFKENIIEPISIKSKAIQAASEVATLVLRVDDIILPPSEVQPKKSAKNQGQSLD
jgi:archaeal chaperonin